MTVPVTCGECLIPGITWPDGQGGCWCVCIYHPAAQHSSHECDVPLSRLLDDLTRWTGPIAERVAAEVERRM